MSKLDQVKIPVDIVEQRAGWELERVDDGITHIASKVTFVAFEDSGVWDKVSHIEIKVGRALILGELSYPTWQTTLITEIIENEGEYKEFKTENSHYILTKKAKND